MIIGLDGIYLHLNERSGTLNALIMDRLLCLIHPHIPVDDVLLESIASVRRELIYGRRRALYYYLLLIVIRLREAATLTLRWYFTVYLRSPRR